MIGRRLARLAPVFAVVGLLFPAAVSARVGPSHSPAFVPCKLLTKSDVAAAIGEPEVSAKGGNSATGARYCNFDGHSPLIAVRLIAARDFAKLRFDKYKQQLAGTSTSVTGVGDAAATDGTQLIARLGNKRFVYLTGRDASGSTIPVIALEKLAKKALSRLR